jgi:hypothetical protein
MSRTRSPGSFSIAKSSRPWLVSSDQSAKASQSLRLVEPKRRLKEDTGSALHRTQVAVLWCGFEGGELRLTHQFRLDLSSARPAGSYGWKPRERGGDSTVDVGLRLTDCFELDPTPGAPPGLGASAVV